MRTGKDKDWVYGLGNSMVPFAEIGVGALPRQEQLSRACGEERQGEMPRLVGYTLCPNGNLQQVVGSVYVASLRSYFLYSLS